MLFSILIAMMVTQTSQIHSLKVANRYFNDQDLIEIQNLLHSSQIRQLYNFSNKTAKEYIIELETLKILFKQQKIQLNTNLQAQIMKHLPTNHPHVRDLGLYLTMYYQMQNSLPPITDKINNKVIHNHEFVSSFQIVKMVFKKRQEAENLRNLLKSSEASDHENILIKNKVEFVNYNNPVMEFQLNSKELHLIQNTISGDFSDILEQNGQYIFFLVIRSSIVDKFQYTNMLQEMRKSQNLRYHINNFKHYVLIEE